ncbi:MAG: methyltransferase domain-containing protein [Magnetococcales bacterium]|nr:methyltransferase domain-containing protein [Magnetococcales bacterium]
MTTVNRDTFFDWSAHTPDPNDPQAKQTLRRLLPTLRRLHTDGGDLLHYVCQRAAGKRVLDIGVVSHSANTFDLESWRHGKIARSAAYCLGIDILEPLVNELQSRGFHVRCADATSDQDLGERFELVFIGDVVEHVERPAALLAFAGRHLTPDGSILMATPNPFSRKFVRQLVREGVMVVNLDHISWVTPSMAYELGRRGGVALRAYHLIRPIAPWRMRLKQLTRRFIPLESHFHDYLYEFTRIPTPIPPE